MKTKILKNKEGEVLRNKDNKELTENWFEIGDEFIPSMNRVFERDHEALVRDKKTKIVNYSILARVRSKDPETKQLKSIVIDGKDEIFVNLTPTQALSLKKKMESGTEINQHLFVVYGYNSLKWGPQIGVGIKGLSKPAKKFEDFDNVKFEDAIDYESIQEEDLLADD